MSRRARSLILVLALLAFPGNLWRWLTGSVPGLAAVWDKAGGEMDPNGRVVPSPVTTDAGIEMDPNG
ncbi:MAG TPA: hypothetical protein VLT87_15525 [Thermoanaerobaculia bacterium]|nr:hypothetical protein [Thermoanaerobaculia bacterium]